MAMTEDQTIWPDPDDQTCVPECKYLSVWGLMSAGIKVVVRAGHDGAILYLPLVMPVLYFGNPEDCSWWV